MDIRVALAQISLELDENGFYSEATAIDTVLEHFASKIVIAYVSPEEVMSMPHAAQIIAEARGWAHDCQWEDSEHLDEYPDLNILRGVDRHYSGGLEQFIQDNFPTEDPYAGQYTDYNE